MMIVYIDGHSPWLTMVRLSPSAARCASSSPSRARDLRALIRRIRTDRRRARARARAAATALALRDDAARRRREQFEFYYREFYREAYYDRQHPPDTPRAHRREHRDHDGPRPPSTSASTARAPAGPRGHPAKPQHAIAPGGAGDGVERIYTPGALCTLVAAYREVRTMTLVVPERTMTWPGAEAPRRTKIT
ncbi:uncharacterized protein BXZ73DRAFT_102884 [Epithele typhae]|uniref:uncharacterized protein n=1 Tax=Epithele typhae TaxID=378194 RepID=UPI0020081CEF|nr:uncharacterized protein BXZ73DRAFT_102884 [Epithele typhae]KAH9926627.1 hypothetical protein BXZ73DRAFT_102884 [Epithele typhae]